MNAAVTTHLLRIIQYLLGINILLLVESFVKHFVPRPQSFLFPSVKLSEPGGYIATHCDGDQAIIALTMETAVIVDGKKLFLNPFMSTFIGNVAEAAARSLKTPQGDRIEFILNGDDLRLTVDETGIPLNLGHARQIVGNVLKGIAVSLKGAEHGKEIRFIVMLGR